MFVHISPPPLIYFCVRPCAERLHQFYQDESFLSDYKRIEGFFYQSKTVKLHLLRPFNKKERNFELISEKNLNLCVFKLSFVVCVVASLPLAS